jgi:cytochrome c oxidase subunit II
MNYFQIIPEQASTIAMRIDVYFYMLVVLCSVLTIGIFTAMIFIAIKFRKIEGEDRPSVPLENMALELTWTIAPVFILLGLFAWGTWIYADYLNEPEGGVEIDIVGKQWMWKVQHANGMREVNDLHVPVNTPIKITLTSQDVLHDYYIPVMRVKQDVVPGRYTSLWFEANKTGEFHIFCAEYCGTEHSYMTGKLTVMTEEDYALWLEGGPKKSPVDAGEFLFSQMGCITCHSGREDARGPILDGIFGADVTLTTGNTVTRDEEYLRESIVESTKQIVQGYTPLMPSFQNQLTDEDVFNLIAYIKSLDSES